MLGARSKRPEHDSFFKPFDADHRREMRLARLGNVETADELVLAESNPGLGHPRILQQKSQGVAFYVKFMCGAV